MSEPAVDPLVSVAEDVGRIAERVGLEVVVIGAVALAVHGFVRATEDIDLALNVTPSQLRDLERALAAEGLMTSLREPDSDDPLGGVIDVIGPFGKVQVVNFGDRFPAVIDDALRSSRQGLGGLAVVPLPHLVALKLYAGGRKSYVDIVELLRANPDADMDAIRSLCKRFRLPGFDALLKEARGES